MIHGLLMLFSAWEKLQVRQETVAVFADQMQALKLRPLWLTVSKDVEAKVSLVLGAVFLAVAVGGLAVLGGPMVMAELRQKVREFKVSGLSAEEQVEVRKSNQVTFADYLGFDPVVKHLEPVSQDYGLIIPKIGVNSKVLAQVSANDPQQYLPALKRGLVQAAGSASPGELGDNFIFGHSTDFAWNIQTWNALFYNLKDLEVGDKIYVYFEGQAHVYRVSSRGIYEPDDVSFLNPNKTRERLVLQTCWPPGTVLKRLIVFAEPLVSQPELI